MDKNSLFSLRRNHILQAIVVVIIIWLVIMLKAVIIVLFVAFLIATVLHPAVGWLHRHRVPIGFAVLLPIVGLLVILGLIIFFIAPQVATEIRHFANQVPSYISELKQNGLNLHIDATSVKNSLQGHFGTIGNVLISVTTVAVEAVVGVISIIIVSLYWLGSYERVQQTTLSFFPKSSRARAADIWARIEKKMVNWIVAQVLLGIVVGVLVWIGALILGLPLAGALGVIAGLLEIVPTLGPIAAAIPGVLLGITISWQTAIGALILYVVVQQIENHLLAPWLLGRTVRLSPIIIIFSLLVGATLYGILGALLAVPVALVISSFVDSYRDGAPKLKPSSEVHSLRPAAKKS